MMNRFHLACLISAGLHALAFAGEDLLVFHGPRVEVSQGKTRVAVLFSSEARPRDLPKPLADVTIAQEPTPREQPPQKVAEASAEIPLQEGVVEEVPPMYLKNIPPAYPEEAFLKNIQGTVWILAQVDSGGRPSEVTVERSSGSLLLDAAAAEAVGRWQFIPARRAGVPMAAQVRIPVRFRIVIERKGRR